MGDCGGLAAAMGGRLNVDEVGATNGATVAVSAGGGVKATVMTADRGVTAPRLFEPPPKQQEKKPPRELDALGAGTGRAGTTGALEGCRATPGLVCWRLTPRSGCGSAFCITDVDALVTVCCLTDEAMDLNMRREGSITSMFDFM